MTILPTENGLVTPTPSDALTAGVSGRAIADYLKGKGKELRFELPTAGGREEVVLPAAATELLLNMLSELGRGHAVALTAVDAELAADQAAKLLNVSGRTMDRWLDEGVIPSRLSEGTRMVRRDDALAFKADLKVKRRAALDELTTLSQELGMGY